MRKIIFSLLLAGMAATAQAQELTRFEENDKYGFKDENGKVVIEPKYEDADKFSEGLAAVELNEKYGFIDKTGKVVIPFDYELAFEFSEGLAPVLYNRKYGFIDKTGKMVIPATYGFTYGFKNGRAKMKNAILDDEYYFIDKLGKRLTFKEELARVNLGGYVDWVDGEI